MIAVAFALPSESQPFARALHHKGGTAIPHSLLGNLDTRECLLIHTGMGKERVEARLPGILDRAIREHHPVRLFISAGYAGAIDPSIPAGNLFLAKNLTSPHLLPRVAEALRGLPLTIGDLSTVATPLETPEEKAAHATTTGAQAIDMESAALYRICRERDLPFVSLRVISDTATEQLAVPFSTCLDFDTEKPRPGAILGHLVLHPWRIPAFLGFVATTQKGARRLGNALERVIPAIAENQ